MYIVIPKIVEKTIEMLRCNGFDAFVVGGCVRDCIIGRRPNDWDVCTSALPAEIKKVFSDYKTIDIGIEHGTVMVIIDNEKIEITTYRIDGEYKDNRRPEKVSFTSAIEEDLSRRDFTINAMAYNNRIGLVDLFNGNQDIIDKLICCVGDPIKRFNEDALRIMRAFRFASQLNYSIEDKTLQGIEETKELLKNISVERVVVELNKILMSKQPEKIIELLFKMDIFKIIIKNINSLHLKVDKLDCVAERCGKIIKKTPQDLSIRLCILLNYIIERYNLVDISQYKDEVYKGNTELTEKIMRALKYDNNTIKEVMILTSYYHKPIVCDKIHIKQLLNIVDVEIFKKIIFMRAAINSSFEIECYLSILNSIKNNNECYKIKDLKVNGKDLMKLGVKDGRVIGDTLRVFLQMVIENPEMNDHEKLMNIGRRLFQVI